MKQAIALLALIIFYSCQHSIPKVEEKRDTVRILYQHGYKGEINATTAVMYVHLARIFTDNSSTSARWGADTIWTLALPNPKDTFRYQGKPVFDTMSRQYLFKAVWIPIAPRDSVYIQIVDLKPAYSHKTF